MKGQMDEKSASNANPYAANNPYAVNNPYAANNNPYQPNNPYGGYNPSELRMEEANPHNNFHANPYLQNP